MIFMNVESMAPAIMSLEYVTSLFASTVAWPHGTLCHDMTHEMVVVGVS